MQIFQNFLVHETPIGTKGSISLSSVALHFFVLITCLSLSIFVDFPQFVASFTTPVSIAVGHVTKSYNVLHFQLSCPSLWCFKYAPDNRQMDNLLPIPTGKCTSQLGRAEQNIFAVRSFSYLCCIDR